MNRRFTARASLQLSALSLAVVSVRPPFSAVAQGLRAPHQWIARGGVDIAATQLCECALWLGCAWIALCAAVLMLAQVPGFVGTIAVRTVRVVVPRGLVRILTATTGVGVLVAPVSSLASPPNPVPAGPTASATIGLPSPVLSTSPLTGERNLAALATPILEHAGTQPRPAARAEAVEVRPGDSLWSIAARSLGDERDPQVVSATWRRWYAVNRQIIGADPGLLVPGQLLQPPSASSERVSDAS